jgi:hypothetical protein
MYAGETPTTSAQYHNNPVHVNVENHRSMGRYGHARSSSTMEHPRYRRRRGGCEFRVPLSLSPSSRSSSCPPVSQRASVPASQPDLACEIRPSARRPSTGAKEFPPPVVKIGGRRARISHPEILYEAREPWRDSRNYGILCSASTACPRLGTPPKCMHLPDSLPVQRSTLVACRNSSSPAFHFLAVVSSRY